MPEVAAVICKFDAYSPFSPQFWFNIHNAARALFFRYGVDQQHSLAPLYFRIQPQERAVDAYRVCLGNGAEWPVVCGAAVNTHRNGQRQPFTSTLPPKFLHRSAPPLATYLTDITLILGFNADKGTRAKRGEL